MTSSITNSVISMQNATNQQKAAEKKVTGATQELGQDTFLQLMMEQLKNQDPMDPMDNSEFLAQQAQFTQVSSLQSIQASLASCNQYSQASSMIGRDVVLQDPNNAENYFYGTVDAINFNGQNASVLVEGSEFPLSSVVQIHSKPIETTETGEDSSSSS